MLNVLNVLSKWWAGATLCVSALDRTTIRARVERMEKITAVIYQPAKTAMQSGRGRTRQWVLEYDKPAPGRPDGLMGWNTMPSTQTQVKLAFDTQEAAIAYATRKGIVFTLRAPQAAVVPPKSYAENFSTGKRKAWDATC